MKTEKKVRGVFERTPGEWWIQYYDADGRRRRECAGTKSAAIALVEKRRNERREHKKMPENFRKAPVMFGELAKKALQYSRAEKRSYRADESRIKNVLEAFGNRPAESITPAEIGDWLRSHPEWTLATKNRHVALIKLVYRVAEEGKKIQTNPARLVHQRKENNARIRFLSAREEAILRGIIEKNYAEHMPELEIALHTGMRRSEMYGMTWECVDLEHRIVTVPRAKNGEVRHVKLNSTALAALKSLHAKSIGSGPVFKAQDARYWFEPAVELAGLKDFTFHCLRHTFASRLVMAGVNLRNRSGIDGTQRYSDDVQVCPSGAGLSGGSRRKNLPNFPKCHQKCHRARGGEKCREGHSQLTTACLLVNFVVGPPGFEPGTNGL